MPATKITKIRFFNNKYLVIKLKKKFIIKQICYFFLSQIIKSFAKNKNNFFFKKWPLTS